MSDLRVPARVQRGDLFALLDPSFELHLIAEPQADWWRKGAMYATIDAIEYAAYRTRDGAKVQEVLEAWAIEHQAQGSTWLNRMRAVGGSRARRDMAHAAAEAVRNTMYDIPTTVTCSQSFYESAWVALRAAQRVRALVPGPDADLEAALALLERYIQRPARAPRG